MKITFDPVRYPTAFSPSLGPSECPCQPCPTPWRPRPAPGVCNARRTPVEWYPWGAEALARAKAEQRPILLSVGYSSCHWCHVMKRESFEDPSIAALMNELFVNIKVDREERPRH